MAKKPKKDQLSLIGVASAILRNTAQQRSLARAREKRRAKLEARRTPEQRAEAKKAAKAVEKKQRKEAKKVKAARQAARTPEVIESDIDRSRSSLVTTVDAVKYDLDVPARLKDARDAIAAELPRTWRGELQAAVAGGSIVLVGWGALVWTAVARGRASR